MTCMTLNHVPLSRSTPQTAIFSSSEEQVYVCSLIRHSQMIHCCAQHLRMRLYFFKKACDCPWLIQYTKSCPRTALNTSVDGFLVTEERVSNFKSICKTAAKHGYADFPRISHEMYSPPNKWSLWSMKQTFYKIAMVSCARWKCLNLSLDLSSDLALPCVECFQKVCHMWNKIVVSRLYSYMVNITV